jgi:hypothetical protein
MSYTKNFYSELIKHSNNKDMECVHEWEFSGFIHHGIDDKCICGKDIKNLYTIKNLINDNELIVGSSCVKKFMPKIHDEYKEKLKERKEIIKHLQNNKCEHCKLYYKGKHKCRYERLTDVYKSKINDVNYINWVVNLKERKGQVFIMYDFLLERKENIKDNKTKRRRLHELNEMLDLLDENEI